MTREIALSERQKLSINLLDNKPNEKPRPQICRRFERPLFGQCLFIYFIFALEIYISASNPLSANKEKTSTSDQLEPKTQMETVLSSTTTIPIKMSVENSTLKRSQRSQHNTETNPRTANNSTRLIPTTRQLTSPDISHSTDGNSFKMNSAHATKRIPIDFSHLFREEIENYPEDEIKLALQKTPEEIKDLYNVINTPLDPNMNLTERVAHYYSEDDNDGSREEHVCRSVTRNIYPREARRENTLVYVPNNHDFMQVIQAEICQSPEEECNYLSDNLPYGMTSVCHQKYAYKKLMYLDSLKSKMASDLFRYPSCCACYVKTLLIDLRSATSSLKRQNSTVYDKSGPIDLNKVPNESSNKGKLESSQAYPDQNSDKENYREVSINKSLADNTKVSNIEGEEKKDTTKQDVPERSAKSLHFVNNTRIIMNADRSKSKNASGDASLSLPATYSSANSSHINHRSRARANNSTHKLTHLSNATQTVILPEDKVYKSSSFH